MKQGKIQDPKWKHPINIRTKIDFVAKKKKCY